jgi:hypothetical protein
MVTVTDPYGRILGFLDRTCCVNPIDNLYYRVMHPVARTIKLQDKTFVRNN